MEQKSNKLLLIIIILLVVIIIGGVFSFNYFSNKMNKKPNNVNNNNNVQDEKDNKEEKTITDEEAITEGTKLYKYMLDTFFINNALMPDDNTYIDASDSKCGVGLGCILIKNWREITFNLSDSYVNKLSINGDLAQSLGIKLIGGNAYLIDGFADYTAPVLKSELKVLSKTKDTIIFNATVQGDSKDISRKFSIKLVNGKWLVDDFTGFIEE